MEENAVIFIGDKPVMNYVLAVMTQFNKPIGSVILKARGGPSPAQWIPQR